MGELLPKGQLAIELAADQRLVALIHLAQSEQPSDRNPRANTLNRQPDHCPLKEKGGLGGKIIEIGQLICVSLSQNACPACIMLMELLERITCLFKTYLGSPNLPRP